MVRQTAAPTCVKQCRGILFSDNQHASVGSSLSAYRLPGRCSSAERSDQFSSRHIKSTDNIRLRELTVGYNIPISNKYINRLRVYFRANNLAMIWAKTKHVDPDVAINGYRQADTPQLKSCVFGINIEL